MSPGAGVRHVMYAPAIACRPYINQVIYPSRDPWEDFFFYRLLLSYSTELPGLNKGLADVPDDYDAWLIGYVDLVAVIDL
jgi:hypothetical protein